MLTASTEPVVFWIHSTESQTSVSPGCEACVKTVVEFGGL